MERSLSNPFSLFSAFLAFLKPDIIVFLKPKQIVHRIDNQYVDSLVTTGKLLNMMNIKHISQKAFKPKQVQSLHYETIIRTFSSYPVFTGYFCSG